MKSLRAKVLNVVARPARLVALAFLVVARPARLVVARPARLVALALLVVASCAHAPHAGGVAFRVSANVPDATLWIDDVLAGRVAEWTADGDKVRHLRAGFHRVEVRAPGYYSVFREIEPMEGARVVIDAQLKPLLD
jgi:hypothetical protein